MSIVENDRPFVIIESPYAASPSVNARFARKVCRWAVDMGYLPFASHLFFPQLLRESLVEERNLGISLGMQLARMSDEVWFCLRPGESMSSGMREALKLYIKWGHTIRYLRFTRTGKYIQEVDTEHDTGSVRAAIEPPGRRDEEEHDS